MSQSGTLNRGVFPPVPAVETLEGNSGGKVGPDGTNNINVVGDGTTINVVGNPGTNTLTISATGTTADSFPTDSGTATPVAGVLNIVASGICGETVEFTGSGNTVQFHLSDSAINPNTLLGFRSGLSLTSGKGNTGLSFDSLTDVTSGQYNCCIGYSSGSTISTASFCTSLGAGSLSSGLPGDYNISIGYASALSYTGGESSNINIGSPGVSADAHTIRIGTTGAGNQQQNVCYIAGIDGVNLATATVVVEASDQLGTAAITAGVGITITPGANTITIAASGGSGITTLEADDTGTATGSTVTVSGGSTGLTTTASGSTLSLTGTLGIANGGTNAASFTQANGIVTYNGTSLVNYAGPQISSTGVATNTTQPAFFTYLSSTVGAVTGNGTAYQVVFDTVIHDNTSIYFTVNGEFVPPVTGFYTITSTVLLDSITVANTYGYIVLWDNTASQLTAITVTNPGALTNQFGNAPLSLNAVYYLTGGHAYSIQIVVSGGAQTVGVFGTGGFYCTYLSCVLNC